VKITALIFTVEKAMQEQYFFNIPLSPITFQNFCCKVLFYEK